MKKTFEVKQIFFFVSQVLFLRLTKQTNKNLAGKTFKVLQVNGKVASTNMTA